MLFLLFACGASTSKVDPKSAAETVANTPKPPIVTNEATEEGLRCQKIDLNIDGKVDVWNYYRDRTGATPLLLKKEIDLNWDGNKDIVTTFTQDGHIQKEEMDQDFDGQFEWIDHYQGNKRVMSEIDTDVDGKYDLFRFYEGDKVRRKEQDTNGDGIIDFWQHLNEQGEVTKIGRDLDGDGIMDVRED